MQYRVALMGAIGSGKTSTAIALCETMGLFGPDASTILSFGEGVRREAARAVAGEDKDLYRSIYGEMRDTKSKLKWRSLLQVWGTEVRRKIFHEDYWVRYLESRIEDSEKYGGNFIVDDLRFSNEAKMLRKREFKLVMLFPNPDYVPEEQLHASEAEWSEMDADMYLRWDSLEYRVGKIKEAIRSGQWA